MKSILTITIITISFFLCINTQATTHIVDSNATIGTGTLQSTITAAEIGDSIIFDTFLNDITIYIDAELTISKDLTIIGNGITTTTIDANQIGRIFFITENTNLHLQNISLINGDVTSLSSNGGAILSYGTITLENTKIENCKANNGGAIYTTKNYTFNNTTFTNNESVIYGGALYHNGFANTVIPSLTECTFTGNSAGNDGGAIYNDGYGGNASPINFSCTFTGNYAQDDGGAICNNGSYGISNPIYLNCTFANNKAENTGGVMFSYGAVGTAQASFHNSIIWNNTATTDPTFAHTSAHTNITFSLIQGDTCPTACNCIEEGMIYNQTPDFKTPTTDIAPTTNGNFELLTTSPVINQGSNEALTTCAINIEANNDTRIIDNIIDMGAYEFQTPQAPQTPAYNSLIDLKVLLEGAWNNNTGAMNTRLAEEGLVSIEQPYKEAPYYCTDDATLQSIPAQMVDWVLVEVRTDITPESMIDSKAGLLMSDGSIKDMDGTTALGFDLPTDSTFHFVIRHRNHLDIMTATPIAQNSTMTYDFTTAESMAFGAAQQKNIGGTIVMFAGDMTQDGVIQIADSDTWKANPAQLNTYSISDINLDGSVQTTDFDLWMKNRAKVSPIELAF